MTPQLFNVLTTIAFILVPLLPTIVVYRVLKGRQGHATVRGTLLGLKLESSGAFAAYVISVLLLLLLFRSVTPDGDEIVRVVIQLTGSADRLKQFMTDGSKRAELSLQRLQGSPLRITNLDFNADRSSVSGEATVPASYIGESVSVRLLYAGTQVPLTPAAVALQRTVELSGILADATQNQRHWVAGLDAYLISVRNHAEDLYFKELLILTHDSSTPLETVPLHSYLGVGQIVNFQVGARVVSRSEADSLISEWSVANDAAAADQFPTVFSQRFGEYRQLGEEVAVRHFTNDDYDLPGQGVRFSRGQIGLDGQRMIPTIGPIPGGVPADKALVVYVDAWRRTDEDFRRTGGHRVTVGDTFERQTDHVFLAVQGSDDQPIDMNTVRPGFAKQLNQPVATINGARVAKGRSASVLAVRDLQPGDVIQLYWAWRMPG